MLLISVSWVGTLHLMKSSFKSEKILIAVKHNYNNNNNNNNNSQTFNGEDIQQTQQIPGQVFNVLHILYIS